MTRRNRQTKLATSAKASDGFANLVQRVGYGAQNSLSAGTYTPSELITKNRMKLEWMYRQSWVAGGVVDSIAEDMTRAGIEIAATSEPQQIQELQAGMNRLGIWDALLNALKWSRLYGGAVCVFQIKGQSLSEPLRLDTIGLGQFEGLAVYDRWQLQPDMSRFIQSGPMIGLPMHYQLVGGESNQSIGEAIHYTRLIRIIGLQLPYHQAMTENYWGESIIERFYDRLLAFDTVTMGAASLVDKAHLRSIGVEGLREILSMGGPAEENLIKMFTYIRQMQTNEGITLVDKEDTVQANSYTFSGLSDMMLQFAQQISGATQIPLVRLMGQSPAGLSSSGESDWRNYYDNVNAQQESRLRSGIETVLNIMHRSMYGTPPPPEMTFKFASLWQTSTSEKVANAKAGTEAIIAAADAGLITPVIAMQELKQLSEDTGMFSNIDDEAIAEMELEPPIPEAPAPEQPSPEAAPASAMDKIKAWIKG